MLNQKMLSKFLALVDANQLMDERLTYELHMPSTRNTRHAKLSYCKEAQEWVVTFNTAPNRIYLTETEAVAWLQAWPELHNGTVLKVACSCHRCSDSDFTAIVAGLSKVSHGACDAHKADLVRLVQDVKEGVA